MKTDSLNEDIEPSSESRQTEIAVPGFTPGPWIVSATITPTGDWPCVRGALDEDGGWVVALIDQQCVSRSTLEPESNARLIAAAPALYDALKESALAVHTIGAYHHPSWITFEQCDKSLCVKAREALSLVDEVSASQEPSQK